VSFGNIAYPEMKRNGYDPGFASGTILAGASLSSMIPPSLQFIIIGILAQLSIGKLYIAGIIPGIVMFGIYVVTILFLCFIKPSIGPSADIKTSLKQKFGSTYKFWPVIVLFIIVLGGIYAGIFTAIEAGGIGAFGAFIISVAQRKLSVKSTITSLAETSKTASIIIIMLVGAFVFNSFLAITRVPYIAGDWMVTLPFPSIVTIIFILIVYIILGCFFDIYAILVITIPIVFPAVQSMGYDLIWFSVIMVLISENGCMTPPFGINLFALSATTKQNITEIYRGVIPFVLSQLVILIVLVGVPTISLFLVKMME
jgi:C4-dicarboxylate transporter DctM subunit